jgi:hypothetical protein
MPIVNGYERLPWKVEVYEPMRMAKQFPAVKFRISGFLIIYLFIFVGDSSAV